MDSTKRRLSHWTKGLISTFHEPSVEHSIQNETRVCTMFADALAHDITRPSAAIYDWHILINRYLWHWNGTGTSCARKSNTWSHCHGCWWLGAARSHAISSNGTDIILTEYFGIKTRQFTFNFCQKLSLCYWRMVSIWIKYKQSSICYGTLAWLVVSLVIFIVGCERQWSDMMTGNMWSVSLAFFFKKRLTNCNLFHFSSGSTAPQGLWCRGIGQYHLGNRTILPQSISSQTLSYDQSELQ